MPTARAQSEPDPRPQSMVQGSFEYNEAKQLLNHQKWTEAAIVLKSILKKHPVFTAAAMDLARALTYSGRREEALVALSQALTHEKGARRDSLIEKMRVTSVLFLTNGTFQIYQDGLNLMAAKKFGQAKERLEKALEIEPDNVEILLRLGQSLFLENDFDSATERLKLARQLNPYEPQARLWLGRALFLRGEVNNAIAELTTASDDLKKSELAPNWLAEALSASGQRATGMRLLENDLKANPLHVQSLMTLARLRIELPGADKQTLWSARKELQLALSRLERYSSPECPKFEGDLGVELKKPQTDMKSEIDKLFQQVENRLERLSS